MGPSTGCCAALAGLSRLRHPLAGTDAPRRDGVVVNFGTPAEHAFAAALDALCGVLHDSGLSR
jgi:GntR family transcriptional regulator / MocR family aminotransferase